MVEAGVTSRALEVAATARRLDRPVYGVPGPVTSAQSRGVNRLLADGMGIVAYDPSTLPCRFSSSQSPM